MNSLSQINVKEFIKNTIDNNYKNFLFSSFKNQDDERFYFEIDIFQFVINLLDLQECDSDQVK